MFTGKSIQESKVGVCVCVRSIAHNIMYMYVYTCAMFGTYVCTCSYAVVHCTVIWHIVTSQI